MIDGVELVLGHQTHQMRELDGHDAERIFAARGLALFDVEALASHGGSLRIYGRHVEATISSGAAPAFRGAEIRNA